MELGVQPSLQVNEGWLGLDLTDLGALVRRGASRHVLDRIKLSDPRDGLVGDGRTLGLADIHELAPDMRTQS